MRWLPCNAAFTHYFRAETTHANNLLSVIRICCTIAYPTMPVNAEQLHGPSLALSVVRANEPIGIYNTKGEERNMETVNTLVVLDEGNKAFIAGPEAACCLSSLVPLF